MSIPQDSSVQGTRSAPPPPPPPQDQDSVSHTVKPGENLSELSARYQVPLPKILDANPQLRQHPNDINVGQQLNIPIGAQGGKLPAQVQVQSGQSLTDIGHRFGVSVQSLVAANGIHNPDMVYPGESLWVPGAGTKGVTPLDSASGASPDRLQPYAAATDAAARQLEAAQGSARQAAQAQFTQAAESELRARAQLELPQNQLPGDANLQQYANDIAQRNGNDAALRPALTQAVTNQRAARGVDDALHQVDAARQALQLGQNSPAAPQLQQNLTQAQQRLEKQIEAEIQTRAGTPAGQIPDAAAVQQYGSGIAQRYAADPAAQKAVNDSLGQLKLDLQAQSAVAAAQQQSDPQKALAALNQAYAKAAPDVQQRILADPGAQGILQRAAQQDTAPLNRTKPDSSDFYAQIFGLRQSLQNLDHSAAQLDPGMAAALVNQALPQIEQYNKDYAAHHDGQSLTSDVLHTGPSTIDAVMSLSGRIAGTPQGDQDVSRLARLGFWDNNSVSNALYNGASAAYPAEVARQLKASGQDPTNVISIVQQGVEADQKRVQDDAGKLADHNRELNWLTQNLGGAMTPAQLQTAIQQYENKDGGKWKADNARLVQQLAGDGATLTQNLKTLNALGQANPQAAKALNIQNTVSSVFNDPAAAYSLALATGQNPRLVEDQPGKSLLDLASTLKLSDQGRKALQTAGSMAIRDKISQALGNVDWHSPDAVAQARSALDELKSPYYERLMGVTDDTVWNKAVDAVEKSVAGPGADQAAVEQKLSTLNTELGKLNAFSSSTPAGQLLRSIGVASAVASLYGSSSKLAAAMQSQNTQAEAFYGIQTMVNSAGLLQKGSELAVGFGLKGPSEGVAADLFKTFASRVGSGYYNVAGGALDLIDGVRSAYGVLGASQDGVSAALSFTSGTGGLLYGASQLADTSLGAALGLDAASGAALGLVGIGLVTAATVGKLVYDQAKAAHQYEGSARDFLQSSGAFTPAAADSLSKQGGLLSGAAGASAMPFLEKYAQMKGLSTQQMQQWVDHLTPGQLDNLQKCLLQTAGDASGDPNKFTNGPAQTAVIPDYSSGYPIIVTLTNTLGVFEGNLQHDGVPLPP